MWQKEGECRRKVIVTDSFKIDYFYKFYKNIWPYEDIVKASEGAYANKQALKF